MAGFETWVKQNRMKNSQGRLISLALQFAHVLDTADATELLSLTPKNRQAGMCALSNLVRYRGIYPQWKSIIERFQLKWSTSTEQFNQEWIEGLLSGEGQIEEMLAWLKSPCVQLEPKFCNMLAYGAICGLRPLEVPMSLELLRTDWSNYVIEKPGVYVLQHFRYKQFNRKTKKALITSMDSRRRTKINLVGERKKITKQPCDISGGTVGRELFTVIPRA